MGKPSVRRRLRVNLQAIVENSLKGTGRFGRETSPQSASAEFAAVAGEFILWLPTNNLPL
ncbi:MAG: hypothetical protein BroJett018_26160 [Chloroflexota bacterium]|nr:MAG: hypothetical protein BroJett018_26160 [Chloroflexota bacterium]